MAENKEQPKGLKHEGVAFNRGWIQKFKSEKDFLKEMDGEGYKHIYEGDSNRVNKLKEVYALANASAPADVSTSTEVK